MALKAQHVGELADVDVAAAVLVELPEGLFFLGVAGGKPWMKMIDVTGIFGICLGYSCDIIGIFLGYSWDIVFDIKLILWEKNGWMCNIMDAMILNDGYVTM